MEITEGTKSINGTCRIQGYNVPAWVAGTTSLDISFTAKAPEPEADELEEEAEAA
jgi:hypothetical protein